jgi:hypothetical protein
MRKSLIMLALLAIAVPAMATPISYSENWDSYTAGSDARFDSPYADAANWPTVTGYTDRQPVMTTAALSAPNSLMIDNGSSFAANMGITHFLGGEYQATAANPIVVQWDMNMTNTTQRKTLDFYMELALDDVTAGTLAAPESHNAIGVAQSKTVRGGTGSSKGQYFDGYTWRETGAPTAGAGIWKHVTLTVTDTTVTVTWGDGGTYGTARAYMGNFNQFNIRHPNSGSTGQTNLDNLTITGGELVPEPATVALLSLGLLFVRRRR